MNEDQIEEPQAPSVTVPVDTSTKNTVTVVVNGRHVSGPAPANSPASNSDLGEKPAGLR